MKGDPQVVAGLNEYLSFELTGYKQYLLNSAMCHHWGFPRLAEIQNGYSQEETRHSSRIMARILLLDETPLMKDFRPAATGETVPEQLGHDRDLVTAAIAHLRNAIGVCERSRDFVSRSLLREMLEDEEMHLDWLDKQLALIGKVGIQNYLQAQF